MTDQALSLATALRNLVTTYHVGGVTGERAYPQAVKTLVACQEETPALTPLWRRLTCLGELEDLPCNQQFGVIFRTIAALVHSEWTSAEVVAWLVIEARRAELGESGDDYSSMPYDRSHPAVLDFLYKEADASVS